MMTIQSDRFGELGVREPGTREITEPTRRRQRSRNTRRPPSGLLPATPALAGSAGCDREVDHDADRPYRMGRWTRLAITVTVLSAVVVMGLNVLLSSAAGATRTVTVVSGDTLWSIAEQVAPDGATGEIVAEISALNGLSGPLITPGQVLVVPAG